MKLFDTHVAEDWKQRTGIIELLQSEKARHVFITKEWHGINGFPPLELDWLETMPTEHRPHARPINLKLYEHA